MLDSISLGVLDRVGAVAVLMLVALAVITDKLVWHTRLKAAESRVERLENMLHESLVTTGRAVESAEVTSKFVTQLPPLDQES